jgi:hypothetical protein
MLYQEQLQQEVNRLEKQQENEMCGAELLLYNDAEAFGMRNNAPWLCKGRMERLLKENYPGMGTTAISLAVASILLQWAEDDAE